VTVGIEGGARGAEIEVDEEAEDVNGICERLPDI